jgi:hypothetical protein
MYCSVCPFASLNTGRSLIVRTIEIREKPHDYCHDLCTVRVDFPSTAADNPILNPGSLCFGGLGADATTFFGIP